MLIEFLFPQANHYYNNWLFEQNLQYMHLHSEKQLFRISHRIFRGSSVFWNVHLIFCVKLKLFYISAACFFRWSVNVIQPTSIPWRELKIISTNKNNVHLYREDFFVEQFSSIVWKKKTLPWTWALLCDPVTFLVSKLNYA